MRRPIPSYGKFPPFKVGQLVAWSSCSGEKVKVGRIIKRVLPLVVPNFIRKQRKTNCWRDHVSYLVAVNITAEAFKFARIRARKTGRPSFQSTSGQKLYWPLVKNLRLVTIADLPPVS